MLALAILVAQAASAWTGPITFCDAGSAPPTLFSSWARQGAYRIYYRGRPKSLVIPREVAVANTNRLKNGEVAGTLVGTFSGAVTVSISIAFTTEGGKFRLLRAPWDKEHRGEFWLRGWSKKQGYLLATEPWLYSTDSVPAGREYALYDGKHARWLGMYWNLHFNDKGELVGERIEDASGKARTAFAPFDTESLLPRKVSGKPNAWTFGAKRPFSNRTSDGMGRELSPP